jgi:hypothetical protein
MPALSDSTSRSSTNLPGIDKATVEEAFKKKYLERIKSACKLFGSKIRNSKLISHNFHFFLVPFPCVEALRKLYLGRLGVYDD